MKTELKHIAKIQTGIFAKPVAKGDVIYLQPKYFDSKGNLTSNLEPDLNSLGVSGKHILQQGDVLFAAKGSRNFAYCYEGKQTLAAASTSFFIIRLEGNKILPQFLAWYLNHPTTMKYIKTFARGSSVVSISKEALNDLQIPQPPIEKQQSIVSIAELKDKEDQIRKRIYSLRESQIQQQLLNALK